MDARCIKSRFSYWDIRLFGTKKGEFDIMIIYHGSDNGINLVA